MVAIVRELDVVVVTGLHPFRGRFTARFHPDGKVFGPAKVTTYDDAWTIAPDLRSSDDPDSAKRKPAGIGVERLVRLDGMMTSTAFRTWLKKESD